MGCDIHMFAERYNREDRKWEKVGNEFLLMCLIFNKYSAVRSLKISLSIVSSLDVRI